MDQIVPVLQQFEGLCCDEAKQVAATVFWTRGHFRWDPGEGCGFTHQEPRPWPQLSISQRIQPKPVYASYDRQNAHWTSHAVVYELNALIATKLERPRR